MIKSKWRYLSALFFVLLLAGRVENMMQSKPPTRLRFSEELVKQRASALCVDDLDQSGGDCTTSRCSISCTGVEEDASGPIVSLTTRSLPASDAVRARHLVRLGRVVDVEPLPSTAGLENQFYSTFRMPVGWDRVANEKNALVSLSRVDPQRAMDLFYNVENPQLLPGMLSFPEDVRADAAIHIFPNYWRFAGRQGLPQINRMAKHIGDTGEYPFSAMGWMISELSKARSDYAEEAVRGIFRQAVKYYERPSNFLNRNEEFLEFLQAATTNINAVELSAALHTYVMRLKAEHSKDGHFIGEIRTSKAVIRFEDENKVLLFKLFPLIFAMDHKWAETLVGQYPALRHARETITYEAAGVVRGNLSESRLVEYQQKVLGHALSKTLSKLQQSDPKAARELAQRLSAPSMLLSATSSPPRTR